METEVPVTGMESEVSLLVVEIGLGVMVREGGATGTVLVAGNVACRGAFTSTVGSSVSDGVGAVPGLILRSELPHSARPINRTRPIPA